MFSFHKPKIYRSLHGCCICRAKSSSSRFTDSKRYENDFEMCFGIDELRSGEICNACVLLVKRWKKLPNGSTRNWHHVVDARAGPGTKSMYKIKNRNKELPEDHSIIKKKHKHKHKKRSALPAAHIRGVFPAHIRGIALPAHIRRLIPAHILDLMKGPNSLSDDTAMGDEGFSDQYMSRTPSLRDSDGSDDENEEPRSRKSLLDRRRRIEVDPPHFSSFLDLTYWKETEICCGIIFKGDNGAVVVDPRLLRPCELNKLQCPVDEILRLPQALSSSTSPMCPTRRKNSESAASSDSGVSIPLVVGDEAILDACLYRRGLAPTPPPPTLEPELPQGELPPRHLIPAYPRHLIPDMDLDVLDSEDEDDSFMPPVMPHFLESSQGAATSPTAYRRHLASSQHDDEDSIASMEITAETAAAAAAVLDLSMGLHRQRFLPMPFH